MLLMLAASGDTPPEVLVGICTFNLVKEGMLDLFLEVSYPILQLSPAARIAVHYGAASLELISKLLIKLAHHTG